jgi:phasin family protein
VQDICKTVLALVQDNIEVSLAVSRELINAKTPQEALDVYSRFCQQQMDRWMQDSSRLSDMSLKLTEQAFASFGKKLG